MDKLKKKVLESKLVDTLQKAEKSAAGLSSRGASVLCMMRESKKEPSDDAPIRDERPSPEPKKGISNGVKSLHPLMSIHMPIKDSRPKREPWSAADERAYQRVKRMWLKWFIAREGLELEIEKWELDILKGQIILWYELRRILKKRGWLLPNEVEMLYSLTDLFHHAYGYRYLEGL